MMANLHNNEELSVVYEKSEYTWILHKFSEMMNKDEQELPEIIDSPEFPENEGLCEWQLQIFPKDIKTNQSFGMYLFMKSEPKEDVAVQNFISLKNSDDAVIVTANEKSTFNEDDHCWGLDNMISLKKLQASIKDDDILKICVFVSAEVFTLKSHHSLDSLEGQNLLTKLSSELRSLIKNDKFHDFIIKVNNGTEIPVHRNILAARSAIFAEMFEYNGIDKKLECVEIKDVDESTMLHLLNFVYTGQVKLDNLSEIEMKKLFVAAHKYGIFDLKKLCSKALANSLTVSNVLDFLILAEGHGDSELKNVASDYIIANFWKFCRPEKLEKLKEYPNILFEIISKIFRLCRDNFEIKL